MRALQFAALVAFAMVTSPVFAAGDKHEGHAHGSAMVPDGQTAPTLAIEAMADTKDGFNLHLRTAHFTFSPQNTGQASDAIEGHAHVYVNGTKIGRVYGAWTHLPAKHFNHGSNQIRVTLNDNLHNDWSVNGNAIEASIEVMFHGADTAEGHQKHAHSN